MTKARFLVFAVWLLLLFSPARSEESAVLSGGRSPDGQYEIAIVQANREPSDYFIVIRSVSTGGILAKLEEAGIMIYPGAKTVCRAWWTPTSDFVVITDRGTQHSQEIYLFEVSRGSARRVILPDYVQNALGRIAATEIDLHNVSQPEEWLGNDLRLNLTFSVHREAVGRQFYSCQIALRAVRDGYARLLSVSVPLLAD